MFTTTWVKQLCLCRFLRIDSKTCLTWKCPGSFLWIINGFSAIALMEKGTFWRNPALPKPQLHRISKCEVIDHWIWLLHFSEEETQKQRESERATHTHKQDCRGSGVFAWISVNLEWVTGSAVAVSLLVNATLCLSFRTPTA